MAHYLEVSPDGQSGHVWEVRSETAHRSGGGRTVEMFRVKPGQEAFDVLRTKYPTAQFFELKLAPGEYFPRMARPSCDHPQDHGFNPDNIKNRDLIATSQGQLMALREQLERICRVVHPVKETWEAFGHDIRNLLILASTEVEAHCKGVLLAHGAKAESTNDYVRLCETMKLNEYAVEFPYYRWLDPIKPFAGWSSAAPTKTLQWYDAYNAVKHDREREFRRATLGCAFEALSGCVVMICAQFGWVTGVREQQTLGSFFQLHEKPRWQPSEVYTPLNENGKRTFPVPLKYAFP